MKKIDFLIQNMEGGGAERVVLNILNNIDYSKFKIDLILLENRGIYLERIKENQNLRIITFKNNTSNRYLNFILNYIKALKYIKVSDSTNVFSQYNPGKLLGFFKFLFSKKNIIYRETNIPQKITKSSKWYIKLIDKIFYRFGITKFNKIIVQSIDMKNMLLEMNSAVEEKIFLINNPIDIEFIENEIKNIEKKKNIKLNLISIGRLSHQKGYDLLIETLSKIKNKNFILKILGTGPGEKKLKDLIKEKNLENNVMFLGFKKNPYKYLAQADFFISSSRFEGFPNTVLEACACGVPVIANNYPGGINEIIIPNLNGEIIDIKDEKAFQKALDKKYDSEKIKENIKNRFGKEIIIKQYENLFFKLL